MKRIFLFMLLTVLSLTLNSCSKDDNPTPSANDTVSMKVGGVIKTFNTVVVTEQPYTVEGVNYVDLTIRASENGSTSEYVVFYIGKGDVGADQSWGFSYTLNGILYSDDTDTNINTNTNVNSDNKLQGTFSGAVTSSENASIELTQGTFDITY